MSKKLGNIKTQEISVISLAQRLTGTATVRYCWRIAGAGWDGGPWWSAPVDLAVELTAEPSAVSRISERIDVFYRGSNNHLWTSPTE